MENALILSWKQRSKSNPLPKKKKKNTKKTRKLKGYILKTFKYWYSTITPSHHTRQQERAKYEAVVSVSKSNATATNQWMIWLFEWGNWNNRATRAARFLVQYFDIVCQTTKWNCQIWARFWRKREPSAVFFSLATFTHGNDSCQYGVKRHFAHFVQLV